MVADTPLSAALEAALARALAAAYRELNESHFKGALKPPAIALVAGPSRLGQWLAGPRAIELDRSFVLTGGWGSVVEVLKHEMAHQYVAEVLGQPDETPHGPAFRALCERLAIDARAAGVPAPGVAPPSEREARALQRIAKLLALAESRNVHESELAMAEAQRLMLKHNLEAPASGGYGFRHLGTPTGRVSESERLLAGLLGDHFFVEVIWVPVWRPLDGKRGSVLEVCGTPVNLELASYVHGFLTHTSAELWRDYKRARGLPGDRDRRTYLAGVMTGFRDKLEAERKRHQAEGLVWVGDADLQRYWRRRHPHVRWTRHEGHLGNEARTDGRAAGRTLVLHRPIGAGPSPGGGRLLPGRRG